MTDERFYCCMNVLGGVTVTGWGAHRYYRDVPADPAKVRVRTDCPLGNGVATDATIELPTRLGRELALAILDACEKAEAAPLTKGF